MNIEDHNGTTVLHRPNREEPPRNLWTLLIGRPLATADAPHQTIGKLIGLAVFASDALSSTAYATQEILAILIVIGPAAYGLVFPISLVIVGLLAIVTLSYEQTIHAYPNGGGAYIVSRDNLGLLPAKIAAAAILTDYILTVAVSISSGVAQIISAYPQFYPYRVFLAVGLVFFIMMVNLRGVRESGVVFAIPTYFFVVMMFITIIVGLVRYFTGNLGMVVDPPALELLYAPQALTLFLLLRAFSNGTTALTGIEAISDGIPAFKEPRSRNAGITLIWMSSILGSMVLSVSFLAGHIQAVPSEVETVISQIARTVFDGRGVLYLMVISATTIILIMAANTSFADFPRLSAITAADGLLPRQLTYRGSRLVFSRGIAVLALLASLLIVVFQASVTRLIPLYAIGVFISFTLSQSGMARRWWKIGHLKEKEELKERGSVLRYQPGWQVKMVLNGLGALMTFFVMIIFAVTKFTDGAWVVLIIIPLVVILFTVIQSHYQSVAAKLSLEHYGSPVPRVPRNRVLLPIGGVHRGSLAALRYARTLTDDITAVHVSINPEETERIRKKWEQWGDGVRLVIIESSYRRFMEPLLDYIEDIYRRRQPNEVITIIVPQFVSKKRWTNLLHTKTAEALQHELMYYPDIVVTNVPYLVD
ncbi:MAG TPA: APC family permease [Anaerolinea thermolimosa]|uniref:APC family permease n=1 Tax=Anaerolinea thermolimosa TaxID=229919 RepID=A0A3D1JIM4_9CHLR|nr:APC family permease [Anaerolinea thermolimosa]GAP07082.1 amino acid/polyamine/organocation transporter, APC superfamily [Anaerolinea thermolimosa]HCE18075.1 APC family permease [Anaerolinea thermolimosa]